MHRVDGVGDLAARDPRVEPARRDERPLQVRIEPAIERGLDPVVEAAVRDVDVERAALSMQFPRPEAVARTEHLPRSSSLIDWHHVRTLGHGRHERDPESRQRAGRQKHRERACSQETRKEPLARCSLCSRGAT